MVQSYFAELSASGVPTVRFVGLGALDALGIGRDGIDGWDSTPTVKVEPVARAQGDGGHDVPDTDILYASRTVQLAWNANASDRTELRKLVDRIRMMTHRLVRLRVVDGTDDTYCDGGYLSMGHKASWRLGSVPDSTLTIVFQRPERLSTRAHQLQLYPSMEAGRLGLSYGGKAEGLEYPLSYGKSIAADSRNTGVIVNKGTSRAYPVYMVNGPFPEGVSITFPGALQTLKYSQPVGDVPLVLDTRSRSASIGGLDVTRSLESRGFATVPPGGSLTVSMLSAGSGWVSVESHDTWI